MDPVIRLVLFCSVVLSALVMSTSSSATDSSNDSSGKSPHELLKLEKVKSPVWDYFGFLAENG